MPNLSAQENNGPTFWNLIEEQKVLVVTLLGGLLLFGFGGLLFLNSQKPRKSNIEFVSFEDESSAAVPEGSVVESGLIIIDIAGAVVSPGVYELESDARVGEALEKASGLSEKADKDWIAKNLNLAQKLSDGAKLYIPFKGELGSAAGGGMVAGVSQDAANPQSGKININTASAGELETLPGIGPSYAQKIIDYRTSSGRFTAIEDIKKVPGIGEKTFQKIKDLITVF